MSELMPKRRIVLLGATGSIGESTLRVIAAHRDKLELVRSLGADVAVNYSESNWADRVRAAIGDAGVDIDAGDALVEAIKPFARRTLRPEVLAGLGGFGALRGEVGDLRLERAGEVGRGVDDRAAELEDGVGPATEVIGEPCGIGIEPENLQRIFEAFFQKTPSTLGIGVGLTISKEIVALHDGEIWVESEGVGRGSVFKVVFPAY